jgi:hypothetical protein
MALALLLFDMYREVILDFSNQQALKGERNACVATSIGSKGFSVLPGFAPAGEALLFRQKDPKPLTPHLASLKRMDANFRRADQLASLKQGPPADTSVPPLGQTAGVRPGRTNMCRGLHVGARNHEFCMISD